MEEVVLNPTSWGAQQLILRAVKRKINSPVKYAFEDGFPVELSLIESEEVFDAVESYQPMLSHPHSEEHKEIALDTIRQAQQQSDADVAPELLYRVSAEK